MQPYGRSHHTRYGEADDLPVYCPDCGEPCNLRHLQSGLDYDWCDICNREVPLDDVLQATDWDEDEEFTDDTWFSIYRESE